MLDRVRFSRVFDFPGVAEAVAEFTAILEEKDQIHQQENNAEENNISQGIADTEDEMESNLSSEEARISDDHTHSPKNNNEPPKRSQASMIVIDNIANVVGPMMTKSQVQGHAMLASFLRSLHRLTEHRHICTLLVNTAVGLRSQNARYHRRADDQVSVFALTPGKPALGKHFAYLVDTSIFLSTLPRSKEDADIAYGDLHDGRSFDRVGVVEVLKDRNGTREGRWSVFTVEDGAELQSIFL
ncbi:MAG: hypothetical protein Q9201_002842 [Fulgogasparrea decipioides]